MEPLSVLAGKAMTEAGKAAVSAAGETLGNAATDAKVIDALLGKLSLHLRDNFHRYLRNAEKNYNEVRTLATEPELRTMTGEKGIYVEVGVSLVRGKKEKEISTTSVESLLKISNRILIEGSGGMGKSMLMKYLFLDTVRRGAYMCKQYIPVFLELSRVKEQSPGQVSISELVYTCMKNHGVELPRKYFPESLRMCNYLFLMDGFDEVKESLSAEVAEKIQDFSTQYPQHAFIVTSRPANDYEHAPFRNFTKMKSMPLNKGQAMLLAQNITKTWEDINSREKAEEFCRQLNATLYKQHKSFAQNPLLLSMMFLTFMRNSSIPNHEAEFYREAYEALYIKHDTHDKGAYEREFRCGNILGKEEFTKLFSRFCFQSYLDEQYDFSEEKILDYLRDSITYLKLRVDAMDYLSDLRKIVCMIVLEGNVYQFAHRSFQEYFAAVYTAGLEDIDQKTLLKELMESDSKVASKNPYLYFNLLFQVEGERFIVNALEDEFRELFHDMNKSNNPDIFLLKRMFSAILWHGRHHWLAFYSSSKSRICADIGILQNVFVSEECSTIFGRSFMPFNEIDRSFSLIQQRRQELYAIIAKELRIPEFREYIQNWLDELDKKRASMKRKNFHKNL